MGFSQSSELLDHHLDRARLQTFAFRSVAAAGLDRHAYLKRSIITFFAFEIALMTISPS